jgi:anti-sigma factor RsiW
LALENNDKILKIYNSIRCLNRDQLPRYLDGRLTEVEKHLVEQHLIDCDLCFDALQALQQQNNRDRYMPMATGMQQYIRNSIKQVSHVQKAERYQRQEQKKESLLIYFWVVAAIGLGAGGIYMFQQHKFHTPAAVHPLASNDVATPVIPAAAKDTVKSIATPPHPPAPVVTPVTSAPVVVKKDSVAKVVPVAKKDSVAKAAAPATTAPAPSVVLTPKPAPAAKESTTTKEPTVNVAASEKPAVAKTEKTTDKSDKTEKLETKPTPPPVAKKDKNKDDDDDDVKPLPKSETNGTDEFMYKAAMVYQQQGDLSEAISRYKHLSSSTSRYGELSRYQLAVCYRSKGQMGKARRAFKEVVKGNGPMKDKAQQALDSM